MTKIWKFLKATLIGGLAALLPLVIILSVFSWTYTFIESLLSPLTTVLVTQLSWNTTLINFLLILALVGIVFALGLIVRTAIGRGLFYWIEWRTLGYIPGYRMVRQTVIQFSSREKSPFRAVAMVRPFESDTLVMAFITDTHDNGDFTVFVPTGPNPTSGNIYFLKKERVFKVNTPIEEAIRAVISCGAGSADVVKALPAPPRGGERRPVK